MEVWATMATQSSYEYIAAAGDTWDSIAYKAYLQERMATLIIKANPRMCHIVTFSGGEKLTIPIVSKATTPQSLPPWRR